MRDDRRIVRLFVVHLVLGLLTAILATFKVHSPFGFQHILIVPFFALTFSQVNLLGLWAVFSQAALWKRLAGGVIGTAYLESAFHLTFDSEFWSMPSAAAALTVVSLLVVRLYGVRLTRQADGVDSPCPELQGFRFSIRGLMALTAVVALLITVARAVQGSYGHPGLVPTLLWSLCVVSVGLLTLRAFLGIGQPAWPGFFTVAVSPVLGAFFALVVNAHRDGWVYITTIMLLYPAVLLGSLLVLRASEYRIVRNRASATKGGSEPNLGNESEDGDVTTAGETQGCQNGVG